MLSHCEEALSCESKANTHAGEKNSDFCSSSPPRKQFMHGIRSSLISWILKAKGLTEKIPRTTIWHVIHLKRSDENLPWRRLATTIPQGRIMLFWWSITFHDVKNPQLWGVSVKIKISYKRQAWIFLIKMF